MPETNGRPNGAQKLTAAGVILIAAILLCTFGAALFGLGIQTFVLSAFASQGEPTAVPVVPTEVSVPTEPVTVIQPTQVPPAASGNTTSSEACLPLDKITTWSENSQGLVYRIEVGGHGGQHMDFYPEVGVKAVSYIVGEITPPEVAAIWWGYGSNWEGNPPGCTFDWIADATAYAEARLDSGHSGLVVDWRSGEPVVVANVAGLSQAQIDALLKLHYDGMDTTP